MLCAAAAVLLAACGPAAQSSSAAEAPGPLSQSAASKDASCAPSSETQSVCAPPESVPQTLRPGHFTRAKDGDEGEYDPYLELYSDGTCMFMCNVYQGMTTYLGTWTYADGVLTMTRRSAEETYVFWVQDEDTLQVRSDLVMTQPGDILTRLAQ